MSTLSQLSQQLTALSDSLREARLLINRLANFAGVPGTEEDSTGAIPTSIASEIHDSLNQLDYDFDLLRSEIEDLAEPSGARRKESERERAREGLESDSLRLGDELQQARLAFRRAQLTASRAARVTKTRERETVLKQLVEAPQQQANSTSGEQDLFAGTSHRRQRTQQLSKDEVVANASSDVTAALRRTHELLSTELSRSRFAQETFDNSTEALKELGEKYSSLDNILSNSRNLLSTLLRSQKSDTWYLETALYILAATLAWLIFRRLLFGPFVKLPLFLWNVFAFTINWLVLRPLYLLLTLVGVIRSEPVPLRSAPSQPTRSRAPLIVQPSAKDFASQLPEAIMSQLRESAVPAGAGGAGAKVGKDDAPLSGPESEKIVQMAKEAAEAVKRGDGTVLQDRGDIPKNPKKKTFDTEQEQGRKRDEL